MSLKSCPNFSTFLYHEDAPNKRVVVARARCKSWRCPYCAEINRTQWVARMLYATDDGAEWSFVTLTANRKTRTLEGSHQNLARGWNRLNLRLKRQFPGFAFVRVWELHETRAFHAHYLWRALPSKRWVKDNAAACGMGFMADIAVLDTDERAKSVFYVAKYMTKEAAEFPKGIRRISCSQNFPNKAKEESTQDWRVLGTTLEEYDAWTLAWENKFDLYDINEDRIVTTDDFRGGGTYER